MTPTKEQIETAAMEYAALFDFHADSKTGPRDKQGFTAGAKWALQQVAPQLVSVEERLPEPVLVDSGIPVDVVIAIMIANCF